MVLAQSVLAAPNEAETNPMKLYALTIRTTVLYTECCSSDRLTALTNINPNLPEARAAFERAFAEASYQLIPLGGRFVFITRSNSLSAELIAELQPPPATNASAAEEIIPAGTVSFQATSLEQVLEIYAALTKTSLIRPTHLPAAAIFFNNSQPLTKAELIFAFDTLFKANGLAMENLHGRYTLVLPRAKAAEPRFKSQLARFSYPVPPSNSPPPSAGSASFQSVPLDDFLKVYGAVRKRTVIPAEPLPAAAITFHSKQSLTKEEFEYALNLSLVVNGLVPVDEGADTVKIFPSGALPPIETKPPR